MTSIATWSLSWPGPASLKLESELLVIEWVNLLAEVGSGAALRDWVLEQHGQHLLLCKDKEESKICTRRRAMVKKRRRKWKKKGGRYLPIPVDEDGPAGAWQVPMCS